MGRRDGRTRHRGEGWAAGRGNGTGRRTDRPPACRACAGASGQSQRDTRRSDRALSEGSDAPKEQVWEGKYIKVTKQGTWEYVSRTRGVGAAVIVAVHEGHALLVE